MICIFFFLLFCSAKKLFPFEPVIFVLFAIEMGRRTCAKLSWRIEMPVDRSISFSKAQCERSKDEYETMRSIINSMHVFLYSLCASVSDFDEIFERIVFVRTRIFQSFFVFFFFFAMINKREHFVSQDRWFFLAEITSNICTWQLSHSQHIICSRSSKFIKYFRVYDRDELFMCPPIEIAIFNAQTTLFRSFSFVCRSIKVFQLRFRSQRNILTCHRSTWLWWCVMRGWNSLG